MSGGEEGGLTDHDVGGGGFVFEELRAVEVADYEAHVGERGFDWFALFLCGRRSDVFSYF